MINIKNKSECCGCEACVYSCPEKCISFCSDEEGFGYPKVDITKCIGCNSCERVCPINKDVESKDDLLQGYIGKTQNEEILQKCSSGGVFTQIAITFIRNGGIVYGASYDDDYHVSHVRCNNEVDIYKISGSKYVQSRMVNVYEQIKSDLQAGLMVLFCGTPCQINGILGAIGDNDNLYIIDLICHAVPSPLIWDRYIQYLNNKYRDNIKRINLRDKRYGYQFSHFVSYDINERVVYKAGTFLNQYLRAFFSGICNRPSCYRCTFKTLKRKSDLTLGDCYYSKEFGISDKNGACSIIVHTLKGQRLIEDERLIIKPIDVNLLVSRSKEITCSSKEDSRREAFFEDVNNNSIEVVLNKYFPMTLVVYIKYYIRVLLVKIKIHDLIKRSVLFFRNR